MGLDYSEGCVNFRDLGEFVNLIIGEEVLPEKKIYRGGSIDYVKDVQEIGNPKSIFNLRNGPDPNSLNLVQLHFPMANKIEKYDTSQKEVRKWLNEIIKEFENPDLAFPVLIHCLSGKDRTGIVVAALLLILGVKKEVIVEEYLLSDGEVNKERIE
ncbi:MAG: tyrosine-protein phosphatase, partial [Bacteroidota bacterium]